MLEIETKKEGAELVSAKLDGIEKIHDGVNFWNRHAPILFPIVGKLKDGKTIMKGETFEMGQHGFARDMTFEEIGEHSYKLTSNEETMKKFPYSFELYVSYEVEDNSLKTTYEVVNTGDEPMPFGIGGHPAYRCEYCSGKYKLGFNQIEDEIEFYQLSDGLVNPAPCDKNKFMRENTIFLDRSTFRNDAIIMKNLKSNKVFLKTDTNLILSFDFTGFKYLAIWSKEDANFICIEPWFNTADKTTSDGIFEHKEDILKLVPKESFKAEYKVEFYNDFKLQR